MARSSKIMNKLLKKSKTSNKKGVNPQFKRWVEKFNKEHEDVLRELAKS